MQEGEGQFNAFESISEPNEGVRKEEGHVAAEVLSGVGLSEQLERGLRVFPRGYLEMMWEGRSELSERMQSLLRKKIFEKKNFNGDEVSYFDKELNYWYWEKFGIRFHKREKEMRSRDKKANLIWIFENQKKGRMARLTTSLSQLDFGENIEEFGQDRRIIYYDESQEGFYVVENKNKRVINIGDILADYAWGLKYFPDPEMPHSIFRQLAKKILVNETRRDIEQVYNEEISKIYNIASGLVSYDEEKLEKIYLRPKLINVVRGLVAEMSAREFLTRISLNYPELGFIVERSNSFEDTVLKYDFKLERMKKFRGVAVEGDNLSRGKYIEEKKRLGIQFTSAKSNITKKLLTVEVGRKKLKKPSAFIKKKVDDIILLNIALGHVENNYKRWIAEGHPSGGPEQYLHTDEKRKILKQISENFIPLTDEQINEILNK